MSASQLSEGGAGRHLHHGAALFVCHEEPPHLVVPGEDVSPHLKSSEVNSVPESSLWRNDDVVEYLARVGLSQGSIRIMRIVILLQGSELLERLIPTQMFPEMNTGK